MSRRLIRDARTVDPGKFSLAGLRTRSFLSLLRTWTGTRLGQAGLRDCSNRKRSFENFQDRVNLAAIHIIILTAPRSPTPTAPHNHKSKDIMRSRSIPISNDAKGDGQSASDHELEQDMKLADYRDFVFCSRLVDGISRKQERTRDIALRYENQALIDHIVSTRFDTPSSSPPSPSYGDYKYGKTPSSGRHVMQTRQRNNVANCLAMRGVDTDYLDSNNRIDIGRSSAEDYSYNDDLIFDLEL